jgi:hypothetical protein
MADNQNKCKGKSKKVTGKTVKKPISNDNTTKDNTIKDNRADKLETIGLKKNYPVEQISDKVLDKMYDDFIQNKKEKELTRGKNISKPKNNKVDKSDPRYIMTLNILNAILKELNKQEIDDIIQFKDISKDELLCGECKKIIYAQYPDIIKLFENHGVKDFCRINGTNYVINNIRFLAINCGYSFISRQKEKKEKCGDGMYKRKFITYYLII